MYACFLTPTNPGATSPSLILTLSLFSKYTTCITSSAIFFTTCSFFKVSSLYYPSYLKYTNCTNSSISFFIICSFSKVSSSYYSFSSKSINCTTSSTSFSTTRSLFKISSNYPHPKNPAKALKK
jgi:hypothetical protein